MATATVPGWRLREDAYAGDVLAAVHHGWNPAENLFRVYQLFPDVEDTSVIDAALNGVRGHLTTVKAFRESAEKLLARHAEAAECLRDPDRRRRHRRDVEARQADLVREMRRRLGGAPAMPSAPLQADVRTFGYRHSHTEMLEALAAAGGEARDPLELPAMPTPAHWERLKPLLLGIEGVPRDTGRPLHAYLARLHGAGTTSDHLRAREGQLLTTRSASTSAERNVLKILLEYVEQPGLAQALLFEAVEFVRRAIVYGWPGVAAAARALEDHGPQPALPVPPADLAYAVWCQERHAQAARPPWTAQVDGLLGRGDLRAAHALLAARPDLPREWRDLERWLAQRLERIEHELSRARSLRGKDPEAAAEALAELLRDWPDARIEAALAACEPPPPPSGSASVSGREVVLSWRPAPARTGRITYRVVRGPGRRPTGPDDGAVVADAVQGTSVVDRHPPPARELWYAVFTVRDGTSTSSRALHAHVPPVLPEVDDVREVPDARGVQLHLALPPGATGVRITRTDAATDEVATAEVVTDGVYLDDDAVPRVRYHYLLRVLYATASGAVAYSSGVHVWAWRQESPVAVTDLQVTASDERLALRWTPPPAGRVDVLVEPLAQGKPPTGVVAAADAAGADRLELQGDPASGRADAAPGFSTDYWLVPVTVLGAMACRGEPVRVEGALPAVRSLRAAVVGAEAWVTWDWPESVHQVVVVVGGVPVGTTVTRSAYAGRGGHVLVLPPGRSVIGVAATTSVDGRRRLGPVRRVEAVVPARARYTVRRLWWAPGRRRVEITSDAAESLPPLRVIARNGLRPRGGEDGVLLAALPAGPRRRVVTVRVPRSMDRPHLNVFSDDPAVVVTPWSAGAGRIR